MPVGDASSLAAVIGEWMLAPYSLQSMTTGMQHRRAAIPTWSSIASQTTRVYAEARAAWLERRVRSEADRMIDRGMERGA